MKQNRIELRASEQERVYFLEAAEYYGMNLSSFIRHATLEKSEEVLKSRDTITLSNKDRDLFLEALENPREPNEKLKMAFDRYKNWKGEVNTKKPHLKKRHQLKVIRKKARVQNHPSH